MPIVKRHPNELRVVQVTTRTFFTFLFLGSLCGYGENQVEGNQDRVVPRENYEVSHERMRVRIIPT